MWQEMIEVLSALGRVYGGLASLEQKKHRALVTVDLGAVDKITQEERLLIGEVTKLEAKRQGLLLRLAAAGREMRPGMKMADLAAMAPAGAVRAKLSSLAAALEENAAAAKEQSDVNSVLLHGALGAVQSSLNRLGGARVEPTYGQGGQDIVTHRQNFVFDA